MYVHTYLSYSNCSDPHIQVTLCPTGKTEILYAVVHLFNWSIRLNTRAKIYTDSCGNGDNWNSIFI